MQVVRRIVNYDPDVLEAEIQQKSADKIEDTPLYQKFKKQQKLTKVWLNIIRVWACASGALAGGFLFPAISGKVSPFIPLIAFALAVGLTYPGISLVYRAENKALVDAHKAFFLRYTPGMYYHLAVFGSTSSSCYIHHINHEKGGAMTCVLSIAAKKESAAITQNLTFPLVESADVNEITLDVGNSTVYMPTRFITDGRVL